VGLDSDANVWGVSYDGSVATRIKVDVGGNITAPDIASGNNNAGCPVGKGDRCTLGFKGDLSVNPYTYSDFSGYGLRNFTQPKGSIRACSGRGAGTADLLPTRLSGGPAGEVVAAGHLAVHVAHEVPLGEDAHQAALLVDHGEAADAVLDEHGDGLLDGRVGGD